MKLQTLKSIIEKKKNKSEFAIITNLTTGESEIFEKNKPLSKFLVDKGISLGKLTYKIKN